MYTYEVRHDTTLKVEAIVHFPLFWKICKVSLCYSRRERQARSLRFVSPHHGLRRRSPNKEIIVSPLTFRPPTTTRIVRYPTCQLYPRPMRSDYFIRALLSTKPLAFPTFCIQTLCFNCFIDFRLSFPFKGVNTN